MVVGLKTVDQLTLDTQISDIRGITEGYNLGIAGNPNDHNLIPGTEKAGVSNPWTGHLFSQQTRYKVSKRPYSGPLVSEVGI